MPSPLRYIAAMLCAGCVLASAAAHAIMPAHLSAEEKKRVNEVEEYLSSINTIVADFVQIAPSGEYTSGTFQLKRPGKMRWEYDPPTPILMVADGDFLVFYDYELEQESYIPMDSTLAGFLAREEIRFGRDVVIVEFKKGPGSLRIALVQRKKPDEGKLTLEFSTEPLQLRNMLVKDAVGQETTVALNNARYGMELDDKLFVFESQKFKPRIGEKKKRGVQR